MSEILEQLILGSANTSEKITKNMQALNLSQSSLQLVDIPKKCRTKNDEEMIFENIFETCLKSYKMIIIAVYKRDQDVSEDDKDLFTTNKNNPEDQKQQKDES